MNKKIGILGSGTVAQTLGNGFLKYGYSLMLGTANPEKLNEWKNNKDVKIGTFEKTAAFADIIVLAVKGSAANDLLKSIDNQYLKGKTIIDATNPIADAPPDNGVIKFFTNSDKSLMETLQDTLPDAHFVKAFSCIGAPFMVNPNFKTKPSMFICGNHLSSKGEVTKILDQFGFETEDMGSAVSARAIEPLCVLWCIPGMLGNSWNHAFKLIRA